MHKLQHRAREKVAWRNNDVGRQILYSCSMSNTVRIHTDKTPQRVHFIVEWAEKRGMKQVDIVREVGADKGLVSRWFKGTVPKENYLSQLKDLFQAEEVASLFRHPDDDWLAKFFRDKTEEQREQAIDMLKILFKDQRTGTGG